MNTNQLKKFAKDSRIKLITQISVKLDFVLTQDTAELRGKSTELGQLRSKLSELGREQLIETVAYTWFNRLMALRFMDANGYNTPKVVTPLPGMSNPEILQNALAGNVEEDLKLDRQRLNDLIDGRTSSSDAQTEAFKLLLVASCNNWHSAMPFMFERISDYTELLLPDDLLSDFSIVSDIRIGMSEEDCQQEELIGWLYQYYISDKKDDVFEGLKNNVKISAENIPAATQLFTPRWIVRYLVENSLGKLWLTLKPESKLRLHMPYFLDSPEGNIPTIKPEGLNSVKDITFLDPCQGSGHVLVYAFELLSKIYEEEGYDTNEIPSLILEHNLYGIDIDERAAQLAAFALTMKARGYYPRFLRKPIQPKVIALVNINENIIKDAVKLPIAVDGKLIYDHRDLTLFNLTQADSLGSLIQIDSKELNALQIQKGSIWQDQEKKLKEQAEFLSRQYYCVVTNPPYMGQKGMNTTIRSFVERHYQEGKADLMTCFMIRCADFVYEHSIFGMINLPSWLFLVSFEELRKKLLNNYHIDSLLHMGRGIFGIDFGSTAFVISKTKSNNSGRYFRLHQRNFQHIYFQHIEQLFLRAKFNQSFKYDFTSYRDADGVSEIPSVSNNHGLKLHFTANQDDFIKIPGSPLGYWLSDIAIKSFLNKSIGDIGDSSPGIRTGRDDIFVKYWYEVDFSDLLINGRSVKDLENSKWFPITRGGAFRKWYGNKWHVILGSNNFKEVKEVCHDYRLREEKYYFKKGITWTMISSTSAGFRLCDEGVLFGNGGPVLFPQKIEYTLGLLNSNVSKLVLSLLNPTLNFTKTDIEKIPYIENVEEIEKIVNETILISKSEWDSHEFSWDFKENELIKTKTKSLKQSFELYESFWINNYYTVLQNETKINKHFINIYGLQDELSPEVILEDVTILQEEAKIVNGALMIDPLPVFLQFLSYSVGCFFGRYSLNKPGLILSNLSATLKEFEKQISNPVFMPDEDNILPVLDSEWFNDDIVGRFKAFLKAAFSEDFFEENLRYVEEQINKDIRKYFVKDFYNDHIKRYKKRPIYWMFSSPKGHFKALIYMHRYQPDLCSKMLNDYLQPFISKLEAAKQTNTLLALREDVTAREKTIALKEVDRLELMIRDCKDYERTLFTIATQKITIDLDDGVKVNYLKFKDVLVPIKGLEKEED